MKRKTGQGKGENKKKMSEKTEQKDNKKRKTMQNMKK